MLTNVLKRNKKPKTLTAKPPKLETKVRTALYGRIAQLVGNKISPFEAVSDMVRLQEKRKRPNRSYLKALKIIQNRMRSGRTFSGALSGMVPDNELNLISAGENGDNLDIGAEYASKVSRTNNEIKTKLLSSITYPIIMFGMVLGVLALFGFNIFPTFSRIMPIEKWPEGAQFVQKASVNMHIWVPVALIIMAAIILVISKSLKSWVGSLRELIDIFPPYNLYKIYQSSIFLITLSGFMRAGVAPKEAIDKIYSKTQANWLRFYLRAIQKNMKQGRSVGESLSQEMFSELVNEGLEIYNKSSPEDFSRIIGEIGDDEIKEGNRKIEGLASFINLVMMAFVAGLVGYLFMTLFGIIQQIRN